MELKRKPFQGVINIIRFNWHFYAIAIIAISLLLVFQNKIPSTIKPLVLSGVIIAAITLITSILVSYYIYDASDLYELNWLKNFDYKKSGQSDNSIKQIRLVRSIGCRLINALHLIR